MLNDYQPLELIDLPTKHDLYRGHHNGQPVFIKKYIVRPGQETADREKMLNEIACYKNPAQLNLPTPIEINRDEQYIVLPFIEYQKVAINEQTIDQVLAIHQNLESLKIDFLKTIDWDYYPNQLFNVLDILDEAMGSELDTAFIRQAFTENQQLIKEQVLTVSHGDFHFNNVRWQDGAMVLLDWENAHYDNRYYDLASMYQSFFHIENGTDFIGYFYRQISSEPQFDEQLFRLMVLRRCVNVLYYLHNKKDEASRAHTLTALNKVLYGKNLGE